MTPPQFPVGEYVPAVGPSPARRAELIAQIDRLPADARTAVAGLSAEQLDTKYRNWTIRQIIHHLADSHVNAYVRYKLALTEDSPTIKPYDESRWAELPDAKSGDVESSLRLLEAIHARWVELLRMMSDADFSKTYVHPEYKKIYKLGDVLGMYAHHGRHHVGQIQWRRKADGF